MKQSINISDLVRPISHFFGRYHSLIFFLLVGAGLGFSMFIVISIVNLSGRTDLPGATVNQTFDEATLRRVDELKDNTSSSDIDLPSGRTNPFVE